MTYHDEIRLHYAMMRLARGERLLVSQQHYRAMRHHPRFKYRMNQIAKMQNRTGPRSWWTKRNQIWLNESNTVSENALKLLSSNKVGPTNSDIVGRTLLTSM